MSKVVSVKLTDEEWAGVEGSVLRSGLTLNAWLRETVNLRVFIEVNSEVNQVYPEKVNQVNLEKVNQVNLERLPSRAPGKPSEHRARKDHWEADRQAFVDATRAQVNRLKLLEQWEADNPEPMLMDSVAPKPLTASQKLRAGMYGK